MHTTGQHMKVVINYHEEMSFRRAMYYEELLERRCSSEIGDTDNAHTQREPADDPPTTRTKPVRKKQQM